MKRWLVLGAKFAVSIALLAWLVSHARSNHTFDELAHQPKHWGLLTLAFLLVLASLLVSIVRWCYLVRALGLPFTLRAGLRLGFVGYLFNFVSLGSVGGDLFKAIFLARELPGHRPQAVATVVLDRLLGLYGLFLLASGFILGSGTWHGPNEDVNMICQLTLVGTLVGTAGLALLFSPGFTHGKLSNALRRLPHVGETAAKLLSAVGIYRTKPGVLAGALVMSLGVHVLSTFGIFALASGLPGNRPDLVEHFIIVPLGMLTAALPLPLNGLGAFEVVVDSLYRSVPSNVVVPRGQGLIVCLAYRLMTIAIATIGMGYYIGHRREVSEVLEREAHAGAGDEPRLIAATAVE